MDTCKKKCAIFFLYVLFSLNFITISTCGASAFFSLPNGETKYLTEKEPICIVDTENGKTSSVETINLDEEMEIIVSFKSKPLCLQEASARMAKKSNLQNEHDAFKDELSKLSGVFRKKINSTQSASPDFHIKFEYYQAFNGVALTCKRGLADMLLSLPMVDHVYTDNKVNINLEKSVHQIRADKVHQELGLDGDGVLVGVIDTGIDYMHPALGEGFGPTHRVIGGYDFINNDNDPMDDHGHGTHVAGIVGAKSMSLTGVAPGVDFLAIKVLNNEGSGSSSGVIAGVEYCLDPDGNPGTDDAADMLNLSLGSHPSMDDPLEISINNVSNAGVLCIVAAGNRGESLSFRSSAFETIASPGTAEKALTVGACDAEFKLASFSSKGPDPIHFAIKPEVVAPGVEIESSFLDGETQVWSGTSMATPHVTGLAALLKEQHTDWTVDQLKWAIVNSANPLVEDYNIYKQGAGCIDAWNAANQKIIVAPGMLSFGMVNLEMEVWSDTVTFAIQNKSDEQQFIDFSLDTDVIQGIQLNIEPSSTTLGPGEEAIVTAEIIVPASVPVVDEEPFAYYGRLLCIANSDTVNIPFGFTKANMLVVEFDVVPAFLIIWEPNTVNKQNVVGEIDKKKYYIRDKRGVYNILAGFVVQGDSTEIYIVEHDGVEIGGLTYQAISYQEAEFQAFPGPIYDLNNNQRTFEDLIDRIFTVSQVLVEGANKKELEIWFTTDKSQNVYCSSFDTTLSFNAVQLWGPVDDLLALTYTVANFDKQEDLVPSSGPENLISFDIQFSDLNENLHIPGLTAREDNQSVVWNNYEYDSTTAGRKYTGITFEKVDYSRISMLTSPNYLDPDKFNSMSLGMVRRNREYYMNDLWTDADGYPTVFERPALRYQNSDLFINRLTIMDGDTLRFSPGNEIYLPVVDNLIVWSENVVTLLTARNSSAAVTSPMGVYEELFSKSNANQLDIHYTYYDNAVAYPSIFQFFHIVNIPRQGVRSRIYGNTINYDLLGQMGFSTIDLECYLPEGMAVQADMPAIDQFIVLSENRSAKILSPNNSDDNKIKALLYDYDHNIDSVQAFLVPSSGEKIALDLQIDEQKREVIAAIPDSLPHEFIDCQVVIKDSSGNQTIFTASPAFFYGNSVSEIVYDSRVILYKYNLENADQYPFTAGDTLTFTLDLTNNGNITADDVLIKYPTTSMFKPLGYDGLLYNQLPVGDSISVTLQVLLLEDGLEDTHYIYSPEITWVSNEKSFKRNYPVYIKTWDSKVITGIADDTGTSTPLTYQLFSNYPNPFNPSTTIAFQLPRQEKVTLAVYNMLGQQVKTLTDQTFEAGNHKVVWDGTNTIGEKVSSGVYFVRMSAGEFIRNNKMVLLK